MKRPGLSGRITRFNPWLGCSRVSPACRHCYAEGWAKRSGLVEWGDHAERRVTSDATWAQPIRWNRAAGEAGVRRRVFCASLADVFEDRPELTEPRERLFDLITATPSLVWMLLTKRPENVLRMVDGWVISPEDPHDWPANVWIGTTVEDQQRADERVPRLLEIPARVRFLSCEPLLGPVELRPEWLVPLAHVCGVSPDASAEARTAIAEVLRAAGRHLGGRYIDWIIAGGESGGGARPMHPQWARQLRDAATAAGVPFLFKQWGEWAPSGARGAGKVTEGRQLFVPPIDEHGLGEELVRAGKKSAGRELDGRTWDEVPS